MRVKLISFVVCLTFISCAQVPIDLKREVDETRKEVFNFSKEYAAITLNMAEYDRLKAEKALEKGSYRKAEKYFISAKEKYYQAKFETFSVQNKWLKEILDELIDASKIKEEIFSLMEKVKNKDCVSKNAMLDKLQLYISKGDLYLIRIISSILLSNYFSAKDILNSPRLHYGMAKKVLIDFEENNCK